MTRALLCVSVRELVSLVRTAVPGSTKRMDVCAGSRWEECTIQRPFGTRHELRQKQDDGCLSAIFYKITINRGSCEFDKFKSKYSSLQAALNIGRSFLQMNYYLKMYESDGDVARVNINSLSSVYEVQRAAVCSSGSSMRVLLPCCARVIIYYFPF